jgi:hypothetical protein
MAIKVIGTGAPRMLTVRFRRCEIDVLLDELHHHRAVVTEAAAHALAKSTTPGAGAGDRAVEITGGSQMARPGLEPGTPRFSVVDQNLSNWRRNPCNCVALVAEPRRTQYPQIAFFYRRFGH